MIESLSRLSRLADELKVLPGHGRQTTLADEQPWLTQVARERSLPF
jgi:glyoxylase-like metal-dependent hydrolase (beta-lactamase superfamily II)